MCCGELSEINRFSTTLDRQVQFPHPSEIYIHFVVPSHCYLRQARPV